MEGGVRTQHEGGDAGRERVVRLAVALKVPLGLLIVEAAIDIGDIKQANHYLELLGTEEVNAAQQGKQAYIQGRLKELEGEFDAAIASWEQAMASPHVPSRAKATVARAELLLKQEQMTPLEAIEELEKLRFAWRGDDFAHHSGPRCTQLFPATANRNWTGRLVLYVLWAKYRW